MKFKIHTQTKKLLADTYTPVGVYARLRENFAITFLLESSDFHSHENSCSFICAEPLASLTLNDQKLSCSVNGKVVSNLQVDESLDVASQIDEYLSDFEAAHEEPMKYQVNSFFGYTGYEAVSYFENLDIVQSGSDSIPTIQYHLFKYVLVFNHFNNELLICENSLDASEARLNEIESLIKNKNFRPHPFQSQNEVTSNKTDEEFLQMVEKGKEHCQRGDVFQMVVSRRFQQQFKGDDFNVYRALRSVNPSPYLFYFDFGPFRIFGSSPEAQIRVKDGKAFINPIAGTFKRTGNDKEDSLSAERLLEDPKENSEHVMLVDLARNDLSIHCRNVTVEKFKEVQYFSHVIHLVSTVSGELIEPGSNYELFSKTFPAGTLSGAPKFKAMQLINTYEDSPRGFYGGAIGFIGLGGTMNQAILIRSFMSRNNELTFQAGAGVVIESNPESELNEVNNKLAALKKAIEWANQIQ